MNRVVVLGGRGFMGRRIMRLLPNEVETMVAGRGKSGTGYIHFDVREPEDSQLQAGDILINTVGPFTYSPEPVVRACIDRGAHYIDLAETPAFMQGVRKVAQGADSGLATITGCSSVPGLIEVFASDWSDREDISRVRAQLSIGTNNESSATLLLSMLSPVGRERWFSRTWLREHEGLRARRYGLYPGGIESGLHCGQRLVPAEFGFGFDRRSYTLALWMLAPLVGAMPRGVLRFAATVGNVLSILARPFGTRVGILSIDALNARGDIVASSEIRAESNGLDVPAWPSVWAAEKIINGGPIRPGYTSLADLVSVDEACERLTAAGYKVDRKSG